MSTNSQTLDDLRYCADNFVEHHDEVVSNLREFAASLIGAGISPPAQKPASVLGGSGAGLVGNPRPLIHVFFKCPDFGTNDEVVSLADWPKTRRRLGRRFLRAQLCGSLAS